MKLNCKAGDLAFTVNAPMDNGLIVSVNSFMGIHPDHGPIWEVTSNGSGFQFTPSDFRKTVAWPDSMLRPIRDQPGPDETLSWCDVPNEVAA